jgi:hypothetical protein
MIFSDLWAGRAVKTTLAPKFGGPAQRWGRAGLGKEGAGWNPGPPFPPLTPLPLPPPSSSLPPCPPPPKAKGEGRRKGGRRGGGGRGARAWRRGCMGWVHGPPPPLAAPPKIC